MLPSWCDKEKIGKTLNRRKKRTPNQTNKDNFSTKAIKKFVNNNYKAAFKIATTELHAAQRGPNNKKKGFGAIAICNRLNKYHLSGGNDKKLKPSTVQAAVDRGDIGVSPVKNGHPPVVTSALTNALATHATMMQVTAGEGEAPGRKMRTWMKVMTDGMYREGYFHGADVWGKARTQHPELFVPCQAKNHEDQRTEWLTAQNINDWFDNHKTYLIKHSFVVDRPGYICK